VSTSRPSSGPGSTGATPTAIPYATLTGTYGMAVGPNTIKLRVTDVAMKSSITRERMQMEKIWKEREKQLDKVLLSTSGLYGSVKGIAGKSVGDIPLLEGGDDPASETPVTESV